MIRSRRLSLRSMWVSAGVLVLATVSVGRSQDLSEVEIQSTKLADTVHMLVGSGGNLGVSAGEDGVFLIDDQFAPLTEKIKAAIATFTDQPVEFVINTHWHGDHVGGNENFAETGSIIVAHENVRERMASGGLVEFMSREVPPSEPDALPVITFTESVSFFLNGEELEVVHVGPAHTDGDAVIFFTGSNVVHMGDVFFNGGYPFVDLSSGGSVRGMIEAVELALARMDGETQVIPGHGPLGDKASLRSYRDMLVAAVDAIAPLVKSGDSLEEIQAASPTQEFDGTWGNGWIQPDQFVSFVYGDLTR